VLEYYYSVIETSYKAPMFFHCIINILAFGVLLNIRYPHKHVYKIVDNLQMR